MRLSLLFDALSDSGLKTSRVPRFEEIEALSIVRQAGCLYISMNDEDRDQFLQHHIPIPSSYVYLMSMETLNHTSVLIQPPGYTLGSIP
jgi:hypothetical protein